MARTMLLRAFRSPEHAGPAPWALPARHASRALWLPDVVRVLALNHRQCADVHIGGGANERDHRSLAVADINARVVDHEHGSGSGLENDAASDWRGRGIADENHVLACGLQNDILP